MISLLVGFKELWRILKNSAKSDESRAILVSVAVLLTIGTLFYSTVEGLRVLDAFYFSFITLATIGYGDFVPVHDISKIFTIIYSIFGIGLLSIMVGIVARQFLDEKNQKNKGRK